MRKRLFIKKQKFDKWELKRFLGGGGNGEVWECCDEEGNKGAIKLLKHVKSKSYARFCDETKIMEQNFDIEGIIPILDKFLPEKLDGSIPYYVMPMAESAEKVFKAKNIVSKIDSIIEICKTLAKLHERGIAHRDIKPPNLLVFNSRLALADFGLVDYPDKKDISLQNEEIGAKWTMAPEMRRESSKADSLKSDVYSLAKTIWIILTENPKGFDGQYSIDSIIELKRFYNKTYTTPIDNLLTKCTDNDPNQRPTVNEIILELENWKVLNKDFHERNQEQWFEIQTKLFPMTFPKRVIWENIEDIVKILKVVCTYDNLNHMLYPNGGGMDLEDVRLSHEKSCIELDCQLINIVKPKRLLFESFGYTAEWNYFRLELYELEPSGAYENDEYYENIQYYEEYDGYVSPENTMQLLRWFRGSFVIFNKRSVYNRISSTYDGRHNKMNTEEFRDYIQEMVSHTIEMNKKKSAMATIESKRRKTR
uniref:Serine/threonine protein kinase n=1 Tax=Chlorobium chlorochromatii (strain CaD3) TaxID=340177 RepID=Q3AQV2_CHLCH